MIVKIECGENARKFTGAAHFQFEKPKFGKTHCFGAYINKKRGHM